MEQVTIRFSPVRKFKRFWRNKHR